MSAFRLRSSVHPFLFAFSALCLFAFGSSLSWLLMHLLLHPAFGVQCFLVALLFSPMWILSWTLPQGRRSLAIFTSAFSLFELRHHRSRAHLFLCGHIRFAASLPWFSAFMLGLRFLVPVLCSASAKQCAQPLMNYVQWACGFLKAFVFYALIYAPFWRIFCSLALDFQFIRFRSSVFGLSVPHSRSSLCTQYPVNVISEQVFASSSLSITNGSPRISAKKVYAARLHRGSLDSSLRMVGPKCSMPLWGTRGKGPTQILFPGPSRRSMSEASKPPPFGRGLTMWSCVFKKHE